MTNGEAMDLASALGVPVKSHSSSLNEAYADMIRRRAVRDGLTRDEQPDEPKPVKKTTKKAAAKATVATMPDADVTSPRQPPSQSLPRRPSCRRTSVPHLSPSQSASNRWCRLPTTSRWIPSRRRSCQRSSRSPSRSHQRRPNPPSSSPSNQRRASRRRSRWLPSPSLNRFPSPRGRPRRARHLVRAAVARCARRGTSDRDRRRPHQCPRLASRAGHGGCAGECWSKRSGEYCPVPPNPSVVADR